MVLVLAQRILDRLRGADLEDPDLRAARALDAGDRVEDRLHHGLDVERIALRERFLRSADGDEDLQRTGERRGDVSVHAGDAAAKPHAGKRAEQASVVQAQQLVGKAEGSGIAA